MKYLISLEIFCFKYAQMKGKIITIKMASIKLSFIPYTAKILVKVAAHFSHDYRNPQVQLHNPFTTLHKLQMITSIVYGQLLDTNTRVSSLSPTTSFLPIYYEERIF